MGYEILYGSLFVFLVIMFIVSLFLIGFSVRILEPLEYGLEVNDNTKTIFSNKLWTSGRYFIGIGHYFLKFPRETQILYFSDMIANEKQTIEGANFQEDDANCDSSFSTIISRSKEGLKYEMHLWIAYALGNEDALNSSTILASQLGEIYKMFGSNWCTFLQVLVHISAKQVGSEFEALEYYQRREEIGNRLIEVLKPLFHAYYFRIITAVILNFEFPSDLQKLSEKLKLSINQLLQRDIKKNHYKLKLILVFY